jgi:hypothetical protein
MTAAAKRAPGVPGSLKQGLFQSWPFKNYFWRKTDRDRYLFCDAQVPWPRTAVHPVYQSAQGPKERQNEKV